MKANDPKLSPLATAELNRKRSVEETLSLADGWFSLAKDAEESLARLMRSRSMKWYKAVAPELTGIAQQRVDQLLSTYDTEPSTENRVKLLPIGKWSVKWKFEGTTWIQFNKEGNRIVCSSNGSAISIFDLERGALETKIRIRDFATETYACFIPDGDSLGVGVGRAGQLDIWESKTQNKRLTISAHKGDCGFVSSSPSGHELLTGGADGTVKIWDAKNGQIKHVLNHGGAKFGRGLFSLDGKKVYVWSHELGNILVFDMATGNKIATYNCHDKEIQNVSESRVGNFLLTASADGTAKLIDKQTGKVRGVLEGHQKNVFCAVARPDGRVFATSAQDRTVRIWDAATRKTIQVLNGHTEDQVFCVQFSPNGKLLASCSYNETLIWEQQP
ncbi:MAG TPA: WD40 repeat domain-containing protein [Planctomycetaceae bacterium]|nr:WD40 repeat domain-containing protein [Planctomycetaceae bacterium]